MPVKTRGQRQRSSSRSFPTVETCSVSAVDRTIPRPDVNDTGAFGKVVSAVYRGRQGGRDHPANVGREGGEQGDGDRETGVDRQDERQLVIADRRCHDRDNRGADGRQINRVLHIMAIVQLRNRPKAGPTSTARRQPARRRWKPCGR
jgi:hypothetical protein